MTKTSLTLNETAWQYACDKSSSAAQKTFDAAETQKVAASQAAIAATKPKETPPELYVVQTFMPETWDAYAARIIASFEASLMAQIIVDNIQFIAKQSSSDIARIRKDIEQANTTKDADEVQEAS